MYRDLGLRDLLKIINIGNKSGKSPQESINDYNKSLNGGYNEWKKEMSKLTGIDISKDPRYNYKQFYDDNPEEAWKIIQGKSSGESLLYYKTPEEVEREKLTQKQQLKGSINDLMDYSKYEKLINNYMNQSASNPVYSDGGYVNIYREGTNDLDIKNTNSITSAADYISEWLSNNFPSYIDVTPLELNQFKRYLIEEDDFRKKDTTLPEDYRNLPRTMLISLPHSFIKSVTPYELEGYEPNSTTSYYIQEMLDDLLEDTANDRENTGKENKNKYYRLYKIRLNTPEGRAYEYWKTQLNLLKQFEDEGSITLPEFIIYPGNYTESGYSEAGADKKAIAPFADYLTSNNNDILKSPDGELPTTVSNKKEFNINLGDLDYSLLDDFKFEPYKAEPWNIQWLQPSESVPIPNWDIQQIRDDYQLDNTDFLKFMTNLLGNLGRNNIREKLMAQLMLPKDYFADPYAGSHYTDTQSFKDAFDNNPYNYIQTESNGTPLYADGGPINIYQTGTNKLARYRKLISGYDRNKILRQGRPIAVSDVTDRVNINRKELKAKNAYTKKAIKETAKRTAQYNSILNRDNKIQATLRLKQAESNPEGYIALQLKNADSYNNMVLIGPDYSTQYDRNINYQQAPTLYLLWLRQQEINRGNEFLDASILRPLRTISPSYLLGAIRRTIDGDNYVDALYGDNNTGITSAFGPQGESFALNYPFTTFAANFITDWAATKGIGAISKAGSLGKFSSANRLNNLKYINNGEPKGFPLLGGRRWYSYKQFQNNPNWYYRVGNDLAKSALEQGTITGKMSEAPFFNKGEALTSRGINKDILVHKGNGNYNWANLDVEGNVTLNPRTWVDDITGLTRMWNDVTNKPVGPTEVTPLVNGKAGIANPADFTVFRPFNIFGKNFGYVERPLRQSEFAFNISNMLDAFKKAYNNSKTSNNLNTNILQTLPAFIQDLFGMNYTGYQMPKTFDVNLSYLPRGFAVGPVLSTNDIVNLPTIITADNKLVTPSRWDTLQQRAINAGDLQELQKLRDYHFIELAKRNNFLFPTENTQTPTTLRHVVADEYNPNFNTFDPTIEGTHSFIYTTDSAPMASSYFKKPITWKDVTRFKNRYAELWKGGLLQQLDGFRITLDDIQKAQNNGFNSLIDYYKAINKPGYEYYQSTQRVPLKRSKSIFELKFNDVQNDLTNFQTYLNNRLLQLEFNIAHPERMKNLYGVFNDPVILDAENRFWSNVGDYNIDGTFYGTGSTRNLESNIRLNHPNKDGFIINNVIDYGGRGLVDKYTPNSVVAFKNPWQLKYNKAITLDDNGTIIPLSKRDNFELGDLRYSLGGNLKIK